VPEIFLIFTQPKSADIRNYTYNSKNILPNKEKLIILGWLHLLPDHIQVIEIRYCLQIQHLSSILEGKQGID